MVLYTPNSAEVMWDLSPLINHTLYRYTVLYSVLGNSSSPTATKTSQIINFKDLFYKMEELLSDTEYLVEVRRHVVMVK